MSKAQTEPAARPLSSLRTRLSLLTPLLLVLAWYGGKAIVRSHVDGLIHAAVGGGLEDDDAGAAGRAVSVRPRWRSR